MDTLFEAPCARAVHSPTRSQTNPSSHMVDDDGDFRQLSAGALVSFGYRVDVAEDGEAAWKALHANSYDLLITDNKMPKISGVELVKKSTRLNSSHGYISYAVFCLKKKKKKRNQSQSEQKECDHLLTPH